MSTGGALELVRRAKAAGLPVTCDVTPHHLALTDEWLAGARRWAWEASGDPWADGALVAAPYASSLRVNPPLRSPGDAAACREALVDGTADAIATDHAPHTQVDKDVEFGLAANGISGIETALGRRARGRGRGADHAAAGHRGADGRAGARSSARRSSDRSVGLVEGAPADLVVFDRSEAWAVTPDALRSKGKNSPLIGQELPGRVLVTVAGGRLAYEAAVEVTLTASV